MDMLKILDMPRDCCDEPYPCTVHKTLGSKRYAYKGKYYVGCFEDVRCHQCEKHRVLIMAHHWGYDRERNTPEWHPLISPFMSGHRLERSRALLAEIRAHIWQLEEERHGI